MTKRYAVVYKAGNYKSLSSTHLWRWIADLQARGMNVANGTSPKKLKAAEALRIERPDSYYTVEKYEA